MTATPTSKTCAALLSAALAERQMSVRQLALNARLARTYTQRIVNGELVGSYDALDCLALVLNISVHPLLRAAAHDRVERYRHDQYTSLAHVESVIGQTTDHQLAACA